MISRRETRQVLVAGFPIGGNAPLSIQSMTSCPIEDIGTTVNQINALEKAGAQIVRLAIRNVEAVDYLKKIISQVNVKLCADIHFDYRIALAAIKAGVHKIRLNPGNIGDNNRIIEVINAAKDYDVPIRIGVNGGSVNKKKYPEITAESLVASALEHVHILEDNNFYNVVVSLKSSDVFQTIEANKLFASQRDYPLHIGLTEAGYGTFCIVQSSVVIGHLLLSGLGDTIRVSMTGDPVEEVYIAKQLLESIGLQKQYIKIISCPTCGRTDTSLDILSLAKSVEEQLRMNFEKTLITQNRTFTAAIMGCEVNGPGEAAHADIGLAGGRNGKLLLFAKGDKKELVQVDSAVDKIVEVAESIINDN